MQSPNWSIYLCRWNYGGFPVWLHNLPRIQLRTNNEVYKEEMQIFTSLIIDMCKKEKLFASQGVPIMNMETSSKIWTGREFIYQMLRKNGSLLTLGSHGSCVNKLMHHNLWCRVS